MATPAPATTTDQQFVQMTDEEAIYQEEVANMEQRGRRLRRAALIAGIFQSVAIVCMIYSTVAMRWTMFEWAQPEATASKISESIGLYKLGLLSDGLMTVSETIVGVLLGMIMIGAGVNAATSSMVIVSKVAGQAILATSLVFLIVAGVLLDDSHALYETIQTNFYSNNTPPIGNQLAYVMLLLNKYGLLVGQVFSGIHLLLLGFSVVMWGVLPRWMGYTLLVAGPAMIAHTLLFVLIAGYDGEMSLIFYLPMFVSQLWMAGWLIVNVPHPAKDREFFPSPKSAETA